MEMIAYVGPMWSGKTEALTAFISQSLEDGLTVGVFDHPKNNRCSSRDLVAKMPYICQAFQPELVLDPKIDVLIFDEVHLYDCFGDAPLFLDTLKKATAKVAVFGGVCFDFYNNFHQFPIWAKLSLVNNRACEFRQTYTVKPCYRCGTWQEVKYSVSIGDPMLRVGDFYRNACRACGEIALREWKDKELLKVLVG